MKTLLIQLEEQMRKYVLLAIMTMTTGFLFGDATQDPIDTSQITDCKESSCSGCSCDPCTCDPCECDPCEQIDECSEPCEQKTDCCDPCGSCSCDPCSCDPCDFCPPEAPETCSYNAPKYYELECGWAKCVWDFFGSLSFVYAQAKQENLTYIETFAQDDEGDFTCKYSNLLYDYKPAFKLGLGSKLGNDNWNFYAEYFRYTGDISNSSFENIAPAPGSMLACLYLSPFSDPISAVSVEADSTWKLDLNQVDFDLRRRYFVGQCLVMQPAVGIRALWINQKQNTNYSVVSVPSSFTQTDTDIIKNKYDSWGIGPRVSLDTEWSMCGAFRLFTNTGVSILYTDYDKIKSNATRTTEEGTQDPVVQDYSSSRTFCFLRPDANIALGIGWADYMSCNAWFLDLSASYEFHAYWNQNALPQLNDCSQDPSSFFGDLFIHGLVITAKVDF